MERPTSARVRVSEVEAATEALRVSRMTESGSSLDSIKSKMESPLFARRTDV